MGAPVRGHHLDDGVVLGDFFALDLVAGLNLLGVRDQVNLVLLGFANLVVVKDLREGL